MIYLTAIGLTPGGSSTLHIYIQTIHRTTQSTQTIHRTTQFTNWEECGPCAVFARYTLAFALQLRKKHGKTSVRIAGECQLAKNIQNRAYMSIRIHKHNNKNHSTSTFSFQLSFQHCSTMIHHQENQSRSTPTTNKLGNAGIELLLYSTWCGQLYRSEQEVIHMPRKETRCSKQSELLLRPSNCATIQRGRGCV